MRTKEEQRWKDLEGKLAHIKILNIVPYDEDRLEMEFEIVETGDTLFCLIETKG